ncbi:MAG: hypothetical protein ACOC8F_08050 [Planctomycetota bacterium]
MRIATTILAVASAAAAGLAADAPDAPDADVRELLLRDTDVPVTEPDNPRPRPVKVPLPPDGSMVVNRACRLRPDLRSGWVVLEFPPQPGRRDEPPRWALPCKRLEKMEAVTARHPRALFRISGETLVYENRPFLLITKNPVLLSRDGADTSAASSAGDDAPAPAATTRPATRPATRPDESSPTPDEIFEAMMRDRPGRPIDPSGYAPADPVKPPSVAPDADGADLSAESGRYVADRLVRIPESGTDGWKEVRFRSDNNLRKPPMRLLPCRQLRRAERMGGTLRVSGYVTAYKGRRYLLLRKCMHKRDMGRL